MRPKKKKREEYQSVWITLDDGTKGGFCGKVIVRPGDDKIKRVVDIKFTTPRPLPDGAFFEAILKQ